MELLASSRCRSLPSGGRPRESAAFANKKFLAAHPPAAPLAPKSLSETVTQSKNQLSERNKRRSQNLIRNKIGTPRKSSPPTAGPPASCLHRDSNASRVTGLPRRSNFIAEADHESRTTSRHRAETARWDPGPWSGPGSHESRSCFLASLPLFPYPTTSGRADRAESVSKARG